MASGIFVSGAILKNKVDTTLDINDLGGGEIAISVDGGDEFVFEVSDADSVISAIREMADRVKKRTGAPEKPGVAKEEAVRNTRVRR